jgi:hypothetical protein
MTAWILVAVFATACVGLLWERHVVHGLILQAKRELLDHVANLERSNDKLLATALEANGKILVDPQQAGPHSAAIVPRPLAQRIAARMEELRKADEQKARDRDERVAAEIDEANRIVQARRGEVVTGH